MDNFPEKLPDPEPIPPIDPNKTPKQIYFELLRTWVNHAQMQQQIQAYFPYYLMNNYPQLFQPTSGTGTSGQALTSNGGVATGTSTGSQVQPQQQQQNTNQRRAAELLEPARQEESKYFRKIVRTISLLSFIIVVINRNGGYEYVIAPLWKRFVAEAIDIVIIFLLKVMLTMAFVDFFDINL